ncbi:hypothetical protein B0J12DRAFT_700085 [Macrophomina phaseolina]|uniref:Uncharacterized protein n=1 Tax=Macrophomina phaseolina TaxID=35725 RepID=A0ABQ8GA34_9PEZI|nr:hypothetical protein B0J12DRAFT_700085 [Macrophomina phaseolina]
MTTSEEYYADTCMWVAVPIFHVGGTSPPPPKPTTPLLRTTFHPLTSHPIPAFRHSSRPPMRPLPPHDPPVFGPPTLLPTRTLFASMHAHARLDSLLCPPALLEDLVRTPALHPALRSLRTCIGSTEGNYLPALRPPAAKMIVTGKREVEVANTFNSKDLCSPHPGPDRTRLGAGLWKCRGRTDDLVVLTGELKMYAGGIEESVRCHHPQVKHALVAGYGRRVPFMLLEVADGVRVEDEAERERLFGRGMAGRGRCEQRCRRERKAEKRADAGSRSSETVCEVGEGNGGTEGLHKHHRDSIGE